MYTITIDYTNELVFEDYDDFVLALSYLFKGGIEKEIKVKYSKKAVEVVSTYVNTASFRNNNSDVGYDARGIGVTRG